MPEDVRKDPAKKCIPLPGGYTLAVKLRDEVLDIIKEHATRARFASRIFGTILERNILKRFIGRELLGPDLCVKVISWQQADRESIQEIASIVQRAEEGVFDVDDEKGDEKVEVQSESVLVDSPEAEGAALVGEHEEDAPRDDTPPADAGIAPIVSKPIVDPEVAKLRAKIRETYAKLPENIADDAIASTGLGGMEEVGRCGDLDLLGAAAKELGDAVLAKLQAERGTANGPSKGETKLNLKP